MPNSVSQENIFQTLAVLRQARQQALLLQEETARQQTQLTDAFVQSQQAQLGVLFSAWGQWRREQEEGAAAVAGAWRRKLFDVLEDRFKNLDGLSRRLVQNLASHGLDRLGAMAGKGKLGDFGELLGAFLGNGGVPASGGGGVNDALTVLNLLGVFRKTAAVAVTQHPPQRVEVSGEVRVVSPDGSVQQLPPEAVQAIAQRAAAGEIHRQVMTGGGPLGAQLQDLKRIARN